MYNNWKTQKREYTIIINKPNQITSIYYNEYTLKSVLLMHSKTSAGVRDWKDIKNKQLKTKQVFKTSMLSIIRHH